MRNLIEQLKYKQTFTISQLQNDIRQRSRHNYNPSPIRLSQECSDIKITSPFYERYNHKPACRCIYHQRLKPQPKKIIKKAARQQYIGFKISKNNKTNLIQQAQFQLWKSKMTTQILKKYYSQFLKTLPNFPKFTKHDKLDNYNQAFQEFLKARFQFQMAKLKRQQELKLIKRSSHTINKFLTEGNNNTEEAQQGDSNGTNNHLSAHKQTPKSSFSRKGSAFSNTYRYKSIDDCTGLAIDFNKQSIIQKRESCNKQKKGKCINRSSFFRLVEDQQLLKQLCLKFMSQNKKNNQEGQMLLKLLVDTNFDQFSKIMAEIGEKIEGGFQLQNLDNTQANNLAKIILKKIQSRIKLIKKSNSQNANKSSIVASLCGKYTKDKSMNLSYFWKIIKQKELSKFATHQRIQRRVSKQQFTKSMEIKPKNKQLKASQQEISTYDNQIEDSAIKKQAEQQFKFSSFLRMPKTGFLKKKAVKLLSEQLDDKDRKSVQLKEYRYYNANTQHIDYSTGKKDISQHVLDLDDRKDSEISNIKSKLHRHVERNKRFLQRMESDLTQHQCEALIIDFGESIITKKRKIRAITKVIESIDVQSKKYQQIQKYLKIFTEYCGLVVSTKKQPPPVYHQQIYTEEKQSESQQLNSLLDDLKRQRSLKFVDLSLLELKENPWNELIIKIPQTSSKKRNKQIFMPITAQLISSNDLFQQVREQSALMQGELSQIAHVKCYNNCTDTPQKQNLYIDRTHQQNAIQNKSQYKLMLYNSIQ